MTRDAPPRKLASVAALGIVLGLALASSGCASYGDDADEADLAPAPAPATPAPRPVAATIRGPDGASVELRTWRGAAHVHGENSHDSWGTFGEIALAALRTGCDFIIMTDHQTGDAAAWSGQHGPLLVMAGIEISTDFGHMITLGTGDREVPEAMPIEHAIAARAKGGIVVLAHPNPWGSKNGWEDWSIIDDVDGLEVANMFTDYVDAGPWDIVVRGAALQLIGGRPGSRAMTFDPEPMLDAYDRLTRSGRRLALLSGSNAHGPIHIMGGDIASYEAIFAISSLRLLAPALDERSLIDAMRGGRAYIGWDAFASADGFRFTAKSGAIVETMGGSVPLAEEGVVIRAVAPTARPCRIRLIRNGKLEAMVEDERVLERTVKEAGVYRVECRFGDAPWVLSNPIYVGMPR